jgi:CheY-like chemotaxis protein
MVTLPGKFRVLIADDDDSVLRCYLRAFAAHRDQQHTTELEDLDAKLFSARTATSRTGTGFDVVACNQGDDAVRLFREAKADGTPFDIVILDVRMPPGISGVEAGQSIREFDSTVILVFVTGFSEVTEEEIVRRVPPRSKLFYLTKPLSFRKIVLDLAEVLI